MLTIRHVTAAGATRIEPSEVDATRRGDGFVWVDVAAEGVTQETALLDQLRLPDLVIEDMRDDRHLPKVELVGNTLSLTVHGLDLRTLERELTTVELDCALQEDLLVTYHDGSMASVQAVGERLDVGRIGFDRPLELLHRVLDVMNDVMVPFVDHLDQRLDVIEEDILDEPTNRTRHDLYRLQRDVIQLRRVVLPQAEVIRRVGRDEAPGWQPGDESLVRDLYDHLNRMVAMCDSYLQLLESATDSYRSALDDRLNAMLATLTIISAVLLPITVVAGLYGMNFVVIPGAEDPDGFWWVVVGSAGLVASMLLWFTARGWIGRSAERRAKRRRRGMQGVLEVPVLGQVLRVPVASGRVVGRVGRAATRAAQRVTHRD